MLLRSSPLLLREGGHTQWPGETGSTGVAGMACPAAFRRLRARQCHGLRIVDCTVNI